MQVVGYREAVDVEFVNTVGRSVGDMLLSSSRDFVSRFKELRDASDIADAVFRSIKEQSGYTNSTAADEFQSRVVRQYQEDVQNVLRLFRTERTLEVNGLVVLLDDIGSLAGDTETLAGATPVDIFNPLALKSRWPVETSDDLNYAAHVLSRTKPDSLAWRMAMTRVLPQLRSRQVDETTAARGFVTRLANSMLVLFRGYVEKQEVDTLFTVHSGDDYQVQTYQEYNYSPVVFGGKKSSPVTGRLRYGYYKFEGWKDGVLTPDEGRYLVSPHNTEATMRNF